MSRRPPRRLLPRLLPLWAAALPTLLSACPPEVEPQAVQGASLTCSYGGSVVYAGSFSSEGEGVVGVLEGDWVLCKSGGPAVTCEVVLPAADAAAE